MQIDFQSSPVSSLGVEMELELVDAESRELRSGATPILAAMGKGHPGGEHPKAKHELLESTVEVITGVCTTVAEARADLEGTIARVAKEAEARGLRLMCSGTHPFTDWATQEVSPDPRYFKLIEEMQWLARWPWLGIIPGSAHASRRAGAARAGP